MWVWSMWLVGLTVMVWVPSASFRKLLLSMLVFRTFIWLDALLLTYAGLLKFPVREFPHASSLLIALEYLIFPLQFGLYVLFKPADKGWAFHAVYTIIWVSAVCLLNTVIGRYTGLLESNLTWYWSWLDFMLIYTLAYMAVVWFYRGHFWADRRGAR